MSNDRMSDRAFSVGAAHRVEFAHQSACRAQSQRDLTVRKGRHQRFGTLIEAHFDGERGRSAGHNQSPIATSSARGFTLAPFGTFNLLSYPSISVPASVQLIG